MLFRKPIDVDQDLTEEERAEKLERFRSQEFDKTDEWAMILAALKVFLPAVLGICAVFALVYFAIVWLWS